MDSGAQRHCAEEHCFDDGTNPRTKLQVATLAGVQDVSVVGDLHIAWETATDGVAADILRQVSGHPELLVEHFVDGVAACTRCLFFNQW